MSRSCAALFVLLAACGATRSADTERAPRRARPLDARLAALIDQATAPVRSAEAVDARISLAEEGWERLDAHSVQRLVDSSVLWLRAIPPAVISECFGQEHGDRPRPPECEVVQDAHAACRGAALHRDYEPDPYRFIAEAISGAEDDCPEDTSALAAAAATARYASWLDRIPPRGVRIAPGRCTIATLLGPVELSPNANGGVVIEETYCPRPDGCWVLVTGRPFDVMVGIRRTAHGWRGVDSNLPGLVEVDEL